MKPSFLPYQTYQDPALADELTAFLTLHQIPFQQKNSEHLFDISFSNNPLLQSYTVLVRKEDFEKVNELLNKTAEATIPDIPTGHYLHTFTDEELIDMVKKPDEWNAHDVHRVMYLLKEKNIKIDIEKAKEERLEELLKPEKSQRYWLIIGYITILIAPIIGILIGYAIHYRKKTLSNGERVYAYQLKDRNHAGFIFILSCVALVAVVIRILIIKWFS